MRSWFEILRTSDGKTIEDIRQAWPIAKNNLLDFNCKITCVRGLMSNVLYILIKGDWDPIAFNYWKDPDKAGWAIVDWSVSPDIVAAAITKSYFSKDLTRAALHYNGKGMEGGIDTDITFRHLKSRKDFYDSDLQYKAALETILSGCTWPNERVHEAFPHVDNICTRCNGAVDSALHCFWTCPCNANFEHEAVTSTQKLVAQAAKEAADYPCLWLRGILPSKFTTLDPIHDPTDDINSEYLNPEQLDWTSHTYYGDASGGKNIKYKTLRRVGCAVVQILENGDLNFGAHFNLPGPVQTVGRGELYALHFLINRLIPWSTACYVTDNKNVYDTFNKGKLSAMNSSNCDLWKDIYRLMDTKTLQIQVRWMNSHLRELHNEGKLPEGLPEGISWYDVDANDVADKYADIAAEKAQLPDSVTASPIRYMELTQKIQKRLTHILLNLPPRKIEKISKPVPQPRIGVAQLIHKTNHNLVVSKNRLTCKDCFNSFRTDDPACKHWLTSHCFKNTLAPHVKHIRLATDANFHIGNQTIHSSHNMFSYKGLLFCFKCGAHGSKKLNLLSKQCEQATLTGERALKYILRGDKPPGITEWPDEQ